MVSRITSRAGQHLHQLVGHAPLPHSVHQGLDVPEAVDGGKLQQRLPVTLQGHFLEVSVPVKQCERRSRRAFRRFNLALRVRLNATRLHFPPEGLVGDLVDVQSKELLGGAFEDVLQEALRAAALVPHQRRVPGLSQPAATTCAGREADVTPKQPDDTCRPAACSLV